MYLREPEGRDDKTPAANVKEQTKDEKVLFINYCVDGDSQRVQRPDRKTIGSHVQKVIRQAKCVRASIKLQPALFDGAQFERLSKNSRADYGSSLSILRTSGDPEEPCHRRGSLDTFCKPYASLESRSRHAAGDCLQGSLKVKDNSKRLTTQFHHQKDQPTYPQMPETSTTSARSLSANMAFESCKLLMTLDFRDIEALG